MAEAMRAYGYSLATAVADLIDNSISAGCRQVEIWFEWAGRNSYATISDDGVGMSEDKLREAMRLGSANPLEPRAKQDLGRFGLGLKTASFSQCRRLTVMSSERGGPPAVRRWDLDHLAKPGVSSWQILKHPAPGSADRLVLPAGAATGTVVLWEEMDRIVGNTPADDGNARRRFDNALCALEAHLGMVFHRYLAGPRSKLAITLNRRDVAAWDPFAQDHPATGRYPTENISLEGVPGEVGVSAFVLPHKDRLGAERHKALAGPSGWNAQQGFYLYRNERLIVAGSWLGLGGSTPWTKEEHYKLARIRLDVPNSMDHLWQLDVKKSSARPPGQIRCHFEDIALRVRKDARSVFAHRGKYGPRPARPTEIRRLWRTDTRNALRRYHIDRDHPVVDVLLRDLPSNLTERIELLLRMVEESVPVEQIWLNKAESPEDISGPFQCYTDAQLRSHLKDILQKISDVGLTKTEALALMKRCDEYSDERTAAVLQVIVEEML
jgi:hypothetical protein